MKGFDRNDTIYIFILELTDNYERKKAVYGSLKSTKSFVITLILLGETFCAKLMMHL